jgi:hypothetical protein
MPARNDWAEQGAPLIATRPIFAVQAMRLTEGELAVGAELVVKVAEEDAEPVCCWLWPALP